MVGSKSDPRVDQAVAEYRRELSNDPLAAPELKAFAEERGINVTTFRRRLNGITKPHNQAWVKLQALTPPEEKALVAIIRRFTLLGQPLPYSTIREIAKMLRQKRLLEAGLSEDDIEPIGQSWPQRLKGRHPSLWGVWSKEMEKDRKRGTSREKLATWFKQLEEVRRAGNHLPCHIYNMDETGYAVGKGGRERCMISLDLGERALLDAASRAGGCKKQGQEWLTTIDCISASGREVDPLVILPGALEYDPRDRPDDPRAARWSICSTKNGWTNNELGLKWLKNVFLPATTPSNPSLRRLLILDGHGSHTRSDFIYECMINNIDLLLLPPHSSHLTQPLDVGVFAVIKKRLSYLSNHIHRFSFEKTIPRRMWLQLLVDARGEGMTKQNIATGFRKTGIEPFDPSQLLERRLPTPSPPPVTPTRPVRRLPDAGDVILSNLDPNISPEKRQEVVDTVSSLLEAEATTRVMHFALQEYEKVKEARARVGSTVGYQETHLFSQARVFEEIRSREARLKAEKAKKLANKNKKGKEKQQADAENSQLPSHAGPSTIR